MSNLIVWSEYTSAEDQALFRGMAQKEIVKANKPAELVDLAIQWFLQDQGMDQVAGVSQDDYDNDSAAVTTSWYELLAAFKARLHLWVPPSVDVLVDRLNVSINLPYGQATVTISLGAEIGVVDADGVAHSPDQTAINLAVGQILRSLGAASRHINGKAATEADDKIAKDYKKPDEVSGEEFHGVKLVVGTNNSGKRAYKVVTEQPQFGKWGANLYPELANTFDPAIAELKTGEYPVNWKVWIKGNKIVRLTKG